MKTVWLAVLAAGFLATGVAPLAGAQEVSWIRSRDTAMDRARETGLPVLVVVTAGAWCDPCTWLDDRTFSAPEVASLINAGYVPLRVLDTDGEVESWGVDRLPTIIMLHSTGEEMRRISGAVTSRVLLSALAPLAGGTTGVAASREDTLRGAVFRLGAVGTLWNDGGALWYSQDAGLPPRMEEYDRDDTFLYVRDPASATLLGIPVRRPEGRGAPIMLWQWSLQHREWRQLQEMTRLD